MIGIFDPFRDLRLAALALAVAALAGCSVFGGNEPAQMERGASGPEQLEVPPDLTRPDSSRAVRIPASNRSAPRVDESLPVAPSLEGISFERQGDIAWLRTQLSADAAFARVLDFLERQKITVSASDRLSGAIESEWLQFESTSDDAFGQIFSAWVGGHSRDRFRFLVEPDGQGSRIYASHAGFVQISGETGDLSRAGQWTARPTDFVLEAEMLRRLMAYVGGNEAAATRSVARTLRDLAARDQAVQWVEVEGQRVGLDYDASVNDAWLRVSALVDRNGYRVLRRDRSAGTIDLQFDVEGDSDSTLLSGWFGGDEPATQQVGRIVVSANGEGSRVLLESPDANAPLLPGTRDTLLTRLQQSLR
ncbi:outer membrane protein assembly factor BamC [Gammaproteobacteria bacterium]|nr:outer membrane protein assembly factor BamC [Gammaproteobacteria bacterium]